jgi:hypothetical protein
MGTDIWMYGEKRDAENWKPCFPLKRNKYGEPCMTQVYRNDRNYFLFRILADVDRMTNQGFEPLSAPRGLPDDLSPELRTLTDFMEELAREGAVYSHNYSWLLLRELLEFPWTEREHRGHTLAEYCDVFVRRTIPLLQRYGGPDDVRIVFWFDS